MSAVIFVYDFSIPLSTADGCHILQYLNMLLIDQFPWLYQSRKSPASDYQNNMDSV